MKKIRVAVIGIGFIGIAHIEALRRLGFVEVVAISDALNVEKKAESLYIPKGYSDYKEMILKENLDAVHICTPNCFHYEMAMFAMEQGLHVMLEKPFTVTLEEAKKLRDYSKNHGLITGLNHSLRMNPQIQEMKALVSEGKVGDIFAVHGSYLQDWLFLDTDWSWRLEPELSGKTRAFSDIGSHWIDMVESILEMNAVELLAEFNTVHKIRKKPLKEVETFSDYNKDDSNFEERKILTEDWCSILFKFENGAIGSLNVSQVTAGRKNQQIISISGSKCSLHWDSDSSNNLWIGRREQYNQEVVKDPSLLEKEARDIVSYPGGHIEGFPDTFKQQFTKFYKAIETNDTTQSLFATFEDGCREMLLNDRVFESATKRAWVTI
jgi:predicted dehydrogenase